MIPDDISPHSELDLDLYHQLFIVFLNVSLVNCFLFMKTKISYDSFAYRFPIIKLVWNDLDRRNIDLLAKYTVGIGTYFLILCLLLLKVLYTYNHKKQHKFTVELYHFVMLLFTQSKQTVSNMPCIGIAKNLFFSTFHWVCFMLMFW